MQILTYPRQLKNVSLAPADESHRLTAFLTNKYMQKLQLTEFSFQNLCNSLRQVVRGSFIAEPWLDWKVQKDGADVIILEKSAHCDVFFS